MRLEIPLVRGQADVVAAAAARAGVPVAALVERAVAAGLAVPAGAMPAAAPPAGAGEGDVVAPGTGAGVALRRGQVLRIAQVTGGQGVDVGVFHLQERGVRLDAARTRAVEGARPTTGARLWCTPPRERPVLAIVADTAPGHDLLYPACTEREYALATGVDGHPSCHAVQREVAAAWGIPEEALHDPLNLWMRGGVREDGALWWEHARSGPGDHVELLALEDVLVLASPCPNDVFARHEVRPIRVSTRRATAAEAARWLAGPAPVPAPDVLVRDPLREPRFDLAPLAPAPLAVDLPDALVAALAARGDAGRVARGLLLDWWAAEAALDVAYATPGLSRGDTLLITRYAFRDAITDVSSATFEASPPAISARPGWRVWVSSRTVERERPRVTIAGVIRRGQAPFDNPRSPVPGRPLTVGLSRGACPLVITRYAFRDAITDVSSATFDASPPAFSARPGSRVWMSSRSWSVSVRASRTPGLSKGDRHLLITLAVRWQVSRRP